jgi:hypothetical protein
MQIQVWWRSELSKHKLAVEAMIFAILIASVVQISAVGISISSRFSGTVYAATGVPIANAIVAASGSAGSGYTTTSSSGQYTIDKGIPTGTYTVNVIKEGYLNAQITGVQVTVGSETTGTNLILSLSGGISGRVTDSASGLPLQDIVMTAFTGGTFGWTGFTDSNGNYNIATNLATGTYNVSALMPEGHITKSTTVTVTAGAQITGVNLALDPSGIILGRVTTPDGTPLANVTISAIANAEVQYYGYNQTNALGYYRIESGLGTGTYTIYAISGMSFNQTNAIVTAGAETSDVNLQLAVSPPTPSGIMTGKVTDASSSKSIADAHVVASGPGGYGQADTDSNGNYVISSGLGTGAYTVTASATGYQQQNRTSVSVTVSQTTANIDFQLSLIPPAQSGRISGTVTGDSNAIPEFQYPVAMLLAATSIAVVIMKSLDKRTKRLHPC